VSIRIQGLVAATVFLSLTSATAEPYALKCTLEGDKNATDPNINVTVDLDHKVLTFGAIEYTITHITDRYITALINLPDFFNKIVGAQIFVLDRVTGNYKIASVSMICDPPTTGEDVRKYCQNRAHLDAMTSSGRCMRPVL
jgi:hypothetical protein